MEISYEKRGDELWVGLRGELDHHSAKGIGEKIDLEISLRRPRRVYLDFENLGFMDSSGLAVIMGRRKTCSNLGGELIVVNLKGAIRKVLMMSGLQKYVKIEESCYETY